MQEVPVYFMIPYVYDLILGPFLLVADQMRMLIFGLYNQGTIMGAITIISIKWSLPSLFLSWQSLEELH